VDVGVPKETRARERRVGLTPSGVQTLVHHGHRVWVETGAGERAGYPDHDYAAAGATIAYSRHEVLVRASLLAAVFAPEPREFAELPSGQTVFAFWALPAARREDLDALRERRITAIGVEAMEDHEGQAAIMRAMSEIAGPIAVTVGAGLLLNAFGGKGILIGGAPGVPPAQFIIVGAGTLGRSAARSAAALGANVMVLDRDVERLREALRDTGYRVETLLATPPNLEKALSFADVVLCAVAVHGQRAPLVIPREMVRKMRPRSVLMDLSIDMGGCCETSRPTEFPDPVYEAEGIRHFCVPNLPSIASRSSTLAWTNVALPYLLDIATAGPEQAIARNPELRAGTYLWRGKVARPSLAEAFKLPCEPPPGPERG
jgi:alanine dehydrogenase